MFARERRASILKMLNTNKEVLVTDLAKNFSTSEVTIRKDLTELQSRNLVIRTRGGAILVPKVNDDIDTAIEKKRLFYYREKEAIGRIAAQLIKEGETIMIDSGTTTLQVAKHLDHIQHLTIITNAINVAVECLKYERFTVILLGGHLRNTSHSTVGPLTQATLKNLYCDRLFLGIDSFNLTEGVSTPNIEEANINQTMIAMSRETIAVCDSSKFNKRSFAHIAPVNQIQHLVTDSGINNDVYRQLQALGVDVHIANM